jgi:hypothetical protein
MSLSLSESERIFIRSRERRSSLSLFESADSDEIRRESRDDDHHCRCSESATQMRVERNRDDHRYRCSEVGGLRYRIQREEIERRHRSHCSSRGLRMKIPERRRSIIAVAIGGQSDSDRDSEKSRRRSSLSLSRLKESRQSRDDGRRCRCSSQRFR